MSEWVDVGLGEVVGGKGDVVGEGIRDEVDVDGGVESSQES